MNHIKTEYARLFSIYGPPIKSSRKRKRFSNHTKPRQMKYLEQIKELVTTEIGRFANVTHCALIEETKSIEEYKVSFARGFNPIFIRAYSNGTIQVKVGQFYESVTTINSSCCYLYVALMNAKRDL